MTTGRITFSRNGKPGQTELWGNRVGTHEEIRKSGRQLLEELRASNKKARVWIDGKILKLAVNAETGGQGREGPFTPLKSSEPMPVGAALPLPLVDEQSRHLGSASAESSGPPSVTTKEKAVNV
jgi:hypothetical protein